MFFVLVKTKNIFVLAISYFLFIKKTMSFVLYWYCFFYLKIVMAFLGLVINFLKQGSRSLTVAILVPAHCFCLYNTYRQNNTELLTTFVPFRVILPLPLRFLLVSPSPHKVSCAWAIWKKESATTRNAAA